MDQLACLREGNAARRQRRNGRCDRRIHTVHVNGDVVASTVRNARQNRVHANIVQFVRGDQMGAIGLCGFHFLDTGTAGRTQADLKDLVDCAISDARRIGLDRPSRTPFTSSRQSMCWSIWINVIGPRPSNARMTGIGITTAAQDYGHCSGGKYAAHHLFCPLQMTVVAKFRAHVAAIHHVDVASVV